VRIIGIILTIGLTITATFTIAQTQIQPSSRLLADLNWQEVQKLVPSAIQTVLLPVGTVEAHGAINTGADCTVPEALARQMAVPLNALVAPTISYGVTGSLSGYPGSIRIEPDVFGAYVQQVVSELARNQFRNIIILDGHGGNRQALDLVAQNVRKDGHARILILDWWSYTSDITQEIFGEDGGHAGNNETAAVQAVNPALVYPQLYHRELAAPIDNSFNAQPNPWSILLYKKDQGYPDFDAAKAKHYFERVVAKCTQLVSEVVTAWDKNGL